MQALLVSAQRKPITAIPLALIFADQATCLFAVLYAVPLLLFFPFRFISLCHYPTIFLSPYLLLHSLLSASNFVSPLLLLALTAAFLRPRPPTPTQVARLTALSYFVALLLTTTLDTRGAVVQTDKTGPHLSFCTLFRRPGQRKRLLGKGLRSAVLRQMNNSELYSPVNLMLWNL